MRFHSAKTEDFGEEEAPDQLVQIQYLEQLGKVQWQELMIWSSWFSFSTSWSHFRAGADSVAETSDFGTAGEVSPAGIDGCEPAGVISGTGADSVAGTSDLEQLERFHRQAWMVLNQQELFP